MTKLQWVAMAVIGAVAFAAYHRSSRIARFVGMPDDVPVQRSMLGGIV